MKVRSLSFPAKCCILAAVVFASGCASGKSFENHTSQWQGKSLSELKQEIARPDSYASKTRWKEETYPLNNGNIIYVEPFDETCKIRWEVTPGGYILKYTTVGEGCKDAPSAGLDAGATRSGW
jgi:hypothetical protein